MANTNAETVAVTVFNPVAARVQPGFFFLYIRKEGRKEGRIILENLNIANTSQ